MNSINPFSILTEANANLNVNLNANNDDNGALILDNQLNNNGSNYCWLNAPLYAFIAFEDVLSLYKDFNCLDKYIINEYITNEDITNKDRTIKDRTNKEQEIIYEEIYNLMVRSRNDNTIWNDELYKSIHEELCKITECDNILLPKVGDGNFSNPLPVIDIFKNVLVKNCPDSQSPLYVETYNPKVSDFYNFKNELLEDKNEKKLIAIIVGVNPTNEINLMSETNEINVGHFIAFVRNKNDNSKWKKYDSGKTEEEYNYEFNDIFPSNKNSDKHWNLFAIYYNDENNTRYKKVNIKEKIKIKTKPKPNINLENFVPIERPKGKILEFNINDVYETTIGTNDGYIYYVYDLEMDNNLFYKIILKYSLDEYSEKFELFLNKIFSNFFSSDNYNKKFRDKEQFYPEMFTFLFGDYLKFICDDKELINKINSINFVFDEEFIKSHSEKLGTYVNNYLNYGLRLDNTIEINRRKFLNNLICAIINPKENIKDNYKELYKLIKNKQYNFEHGFIIPNKRTSKYDMSKITNDFKNKKITDNTYEYLYNYDISEKINISNDFTCVINWIFKTFNKYFLGISDITENDKLEQEDYKLLNEYFEAQKSINFKDGNNAYKNLNDFIKKYVKKNYREIFYSKWKSLLNYFSNFNRYYYDDYYFNKLEDTSQSLSHCLENFISSKLIPNNNNDDPSNFRYLFLYCLMSTQQHNQLIEIYRSVEKEDSTIQISKLKYNFFKYLKYIQNLNQFNPNCILDSEPNSTIINYSKYYFTKIIKFYKTDKLDFKLEYEKEADIEIFKNYIIYFIESETINNLYSQLEIDKKNIYKEIEKFIDLQYYKIYIEKSIDLYGIDYTVSIKDLLSSILKQIKKYELDDKLFFSINTIISLLEKSNQRIKSKLIEFTIKSKSGCVKCPNYYLGKSEYYLQIINEGIKKTFDKKNFKDIEESELPPYSKVLMSDEKYDEQTENKLWIIDSEIPLQVKGIYNQTVINCVKSIIQISKEYNFFYILDVIEEEQKDGLIKNINDVIVEMTKYLQSLYDENPQDFVCDSGRISSKFENKVFNYIEKQKINKKITKLFDGINDYNVVELSIKYFIPNKNINENENSLGIHIYNLINENKYKSNDQSFLEIIKKKVLNDDDIYINQEVFTLNFINFVNEGLKELMEEYYIKKTNPKDEKELISDLTNNVILKFKRLSGIKIKDSDIIININPKEKLYSKIKLFLETCDEISQISKYYEFEQIDIAVKSFLNYYKDREIPRQETNKIFCNYMFELFNTELKLISKEEKLYNILINPEYYNLYINKFVSMGVIIANFIYRYKSKLDKEFKLYEGMGEEYIQNAIDYLYHIYLLEKDKLSEIQDIYNYIYEDVSRYIHILKCIDELFNSIRFKLEVSPQYSSENLVKIKNKIIDLLFNSKENIKFGNNIVDTDIFTNDTNINKKLMKIFGYVKTINKIEKLSEENKNNEETRLETKITSNKNLKSNTKQPITFANVVEPLLEDKLKSTIEIKDTNIRIYVNPETKESVYQIIKSYLETCDEISNLSVYYYPTQIESGINLLINYYNDKLIEIDEKTFCNDFTNNLICLMMRYIIDSYTRLKNIKIHQEFFKIWPSKYVNIGIMLMNYILYYQLFNLEEYTQDVIDYLSNFYLTKDFTGIITKDGFYNIFNDDIKRYQYIVGCLNKFYYHDKRQFFIINIKPKYTPQVLKIIEKHIIDLLMTSDNINISYYTKGRQDDIIINMNDKLYNKTIEYPCISNNDFTKLINHFSKELNKASEPTKSIISAYKLTAPTAPTLTAPTLTAPILTIPDNQQVVSQSISEKISYDNMNNVFIVPEKYNYTITPPKKTYIKPVNQKNVENLKDCLDNFLINKDNLGMFSIYTKKELENIFNLMGEKLQDPSGLPNDRNKNGKEIFYEIKSKWCFNNGLKSLFTLSRDELGIKSR